MLSNLTIIATYSKALVSFAKGFHPATRHSKAFSHILAWLYQIYEKSLFQSVLYKLTLSRNESDKGIVKKKAKFCFEQFLELLLKSYNGQKGLWLKLWYSFIKLPKVLAYVVYDFQKREPSASNRIWLLYYNSCTISFTISILRFAASTSKLWKSVSALSSALSDMERSTTNGMPLR